MERTELRMFLAIALAPSIALAGTVEFSPDFVVAAPGDSVLFDIAITDTGVLATFNSVDIVIGSDGPSIVGFAYDAGFSAAMIFLLDPPVAAGIYPSDLHVGGFTFVPVSPPIIVGSFSVDTSGFAPGFYTVVADFDGDGGISQVTSGPDIEPLFGLAIILVGGGPECEGDADCDDGDPCTDDVCDAGTCVYTNNVAPCDDGDPCTVADACAAGVCVSGSPPNCSGAGDQCNTASCDPMGAEGNCDVLTPDNEGLACDEGDPCTVGDTCQAGVCVSGPPADCLGAGGQCNTASCDPMGAEGNCDVLVPVANGTDCDDGNVCTESDVCLAGVCGGTPVPDCVIFVDAQGSDTPHDGSSWCNAFLTVQDALSVALPGATIRVAGGTYMPDGGRIPVGGAHVPGTGDRAATFQLISGATIQGGYAGCGAPAAGARDIDLYETILSGDLNDDDVPSGSDCCTAHPAPGCDDPTCEGIVCGTDSFCCAIEWDSDCVLLAVSMCGGLCGGDNGENSYHVVRGTSTDGTAVLDGFTISGGHANGGGSDNAGAGIDNASGSPTIVNCRIAGNFAVGGAGALNTGGTQTYRNCTFTGNETIDWGGACYIEGSPSFTDCVFESNVAGSVGGALAVLSTMNPTLLRCVFDGNSADNGGAMYVGSGDSATLVNCSLFGNSSTITGGAVSNWGTVTVVNSILTGNNSVVAGAIRTNSGSSLILTNSSLSLNTAGAIGGIHNSSGDVTLSNSILWGNSDNSGTTEAAQTDGDGTYDVNYSIIQGLSGTLGGTGNIGGDPLLVDADGPDNVPGTEDDNLRLSPGSPAIDAADTTAVPADTADVDDDADTSERTPLDLDGNLRFVDDPDTPDTGVPGSAVVDMGSYEYFPDCNDNSIPDECDLDCGALGGECNLPGCGLSADCNGNGVLDECDIADGTSPDCNVNGIPDDCDITSGFSQDVKPPDGVPDECAGFTGGCDPPTDEWTCFDNWDLPGDQYPDDQDSAAEVFVTLGPGNSVLLNEDVTIPGLNIEAGAFLRITQSGAEGDLDFSAPGTFVIAGAVGVAGDRAVGLAGAQRPEVTVTAGGVYSADASIAGVVSAALHTLDLTIGGGDRFPAGPCELGGRVELTDSMSVVTTGDLTLDGSDVTFCMPGLVAVALGGISPPPKLNIRDIGSISIRGNFNMLRSSGTVNDSSVGVQLGGDMDNQCTSAGLFDWRLGRLVLDGDDPQTFEVAGIDMGATLEGFSTDQDTLFETGAHTNFSIGTVEVAGTANVTFVNHFSNSVGAGACNEALYVGDLVFEPGATVTLSDCRVYYGAWDSNGVVPTLEGCAALVPVEGIAPLLAERVVLAKNRFISFIVAPEGSGATTALRVELTSLHHPSAPPNAPDFSAFEGQLRYVNAFRDNTTGEPVFDCPDSVAFGTSYKCATLGCDPEYLEWAALLGGAALHVTGSAVVPSSQYRVWQLAASCAGNEAACPAASAELSVVTGLWGDVDPGQLNVLDIARQVDKVRDLPGALPEVQSVLRPADPTPVETDVNVLDIAFTVDALKDSPYAFAIDGCG